MYINKHQKTLSVWQMALCGLATRVLCICSLLVTMNVYAQSNVDFYRVYVPVTSQTIAERERAAKEGIEIVIRRMADSRQPNFASLLTDVQSKAWSYVQQFEYQAITPEQEDAGENYVNRLMMLFSPQVIKTLFRQAQINFWPESRPNTLVWLVEDTVEEGKKLLNAYSDSRVVEGMNRAAELRGLPIVYPILDLEDQIELSADQVWSLDDEAIRAASKRYKADVILVGRFSVTSTGKVRATWQFYHQNDTRVYDNMADDISLIGGLGLTPLADYLLSKYAIPAVSEQSPDFIMRITGVSQFGIYRQVIDYLESLTIVRHVMVQATGGDELILSVRAETEIDRFVATVKLGGKLSVVSTSSSSGLPEWQRSALGTPQNPLICRWNR